MLSEYIPLTLRFNTALHLTVVEEVIVDSLNSTGFDAAATFVVKFSRTKEASLCVSSRAYVRTSRSGAAAVDTQTGTIIDVLPLVPLVALQDAALGCSGGA